MQFNPTAKADINEIGPDESLQRLIYSAARVGYGYTWAQVNGLAQRLLEQTAPDTQLSLLLNALCCATEAATEAESSEWYTSARKCDAL
jgi:hypothetical protein